MKVNRLCVSDITDKRHNRRLRDEGRSFFSYSCSKISELSLSLMNDKGQTADLWTWPAAAMREE